MVDALPKDIERAVSGNGMEVSWMVHNDVISACCWLLLHACVEFGPLPSMISSRQIDESIFLEYCRFLPARLTSRFLLPISYLVLVLCCSKVEEPCA